MNFKLPLLSPLQVLCVAGMLLICNLTADLYAQGTCANAQTVSAGVYTVDVINGANIITSCSNASSAKWYAYTPAANYMVTVTSDLSQNICKDTNVSIYSGTCAGLNCIAEDDDSGLIQCTGSGSSYLSVTTFEALAGNTYYIAWDNRWSTSGFDFQIIEAPFVPSPCSTATVVGAGTVVVPTLSGANVVTACSNASAAAWYSYTPGANYNLTITSDLAVNTCKNTNFSVYTGSCTGGLNCIGSDDDSGVISCDNPAGSLLSTKSFIVTAGVTYYIVWDNKWSNDGFSFQINEQPIIVPINYNSQNVSTINSAYRMCIVDMNNDGKDDVVGVSPGLLKVHYQGAGGTLTPQEFSVSGVSKMPSWSLAAGDYNKDGFNDLILGAGDGLSFWRSDANGSAYTSITPGEYIFCQRTNFVDINNDGNLDAFSCHDVDPNVYYINDGNGQMTYYQSGITPGALNLGVLMSGGNYASLWSDMDNDGDVDMFISKCSGPPCELHRNDGAAGYTDISAAAGITFQPVQSWSSAIADFDNDGDMDILVGTNGWVGSRLFRNNLDTTNTVEEAYSDITTGSGWDSDTSSNRDYVAYDFDNDGWVDVLGGGNKIMFNNGDMTFTPASYPGLSIGAIGDLNADGFLDILNSSTIRYGIPNGNNWIKVGLQGLQSNSNGIGARVEIYGPFGKKIRDVRSGEGFGYMSTLDVHFGLGEAATVDSMVIRWPSGTVDTVINPSVNQSLTVVEGSTLSTSSFNSADLSILPNPASEYLEVLLSNNTSTISTVRIFDLNGRLVLQATPENSIVRVKMLQAGTYLVLVETASGAKYTQKLVKQ